MSHTSLIGGTIVCALWVYGVWKAIGWWSPRFLAEDRRPRASRQASILPKLYWICQTVIAIGLLIVTTSYGRPFQALGPPVLFLGIAGLIAILVRVEIATQPQANMIRLATRFKIKTETGYEDALYWCRAQWIFERPGYVFGAAFLLGSGFVLTFFSSEFRFISAVGFFLQFGFFGLFRYTTLLAKRESITIHRWLEGYPVTRIRSTDIASIRVDQPLLHRLFRTWRLTVEGVDGTRIKIALKDPDKARNCLDEIRATV